MTLPGVRTFREVIKSNEVLGERAWNTAVSSRFLGMTSAIMKQSNSDNIREVTAMS